MAGLFNPSEIYNMLQQRGMVPRLVDAHPYGQRGAGLFAQYPNVVVARDPTKVTTPSAVENRTDTLAHEFTHATQMNLLYPALEEIQNKIKNKEKVTKEETQFYEAMTKLMETNPSLSSMLNKMYLSSGDRSEDKYRTSIPELQAWGVGYMSRPTDFMNKEKENINPHLNPSMASEFSIISALYSKLPESLKKLSVESRKKEIEDARKKDRQDFYKESVDVFADPFKSSIK